MAHNYSISKKSNKKLVSFIIILTMIFSSTMPVFGASQTSKSVKLNSTTGTVAVKKGSTGVKVNSGMRILDGYSVVTSAKSYAFLELDSSKFAKIDQNSNVKIKKKGGTNELQIASGSLFFNVKKPLQNNESLKVKTSNVTMSVRGTTGTVGTTPIYDSNGKLIQVIINTQIYTGEGYVEWENEKNGEKGENVITPNLQLIISIDANTGNQTVETKGLDANGKDIPPSSLEELLKDKDIANQVEKNLNSEIDKLKETLKTTTENESKKTEELITTLEGALEKFQEKTPEQIISTKDSNTNEITETPPVIPGGGGGGGGGGSTISPNNNIQSASALISALAGNTDIGAAPVAITITGNVTLSNTTAFMPSYRNLGNGTAPIALTPLKYYNVTINVAAGATFDASAVDLKLEDDSYIINNGTMKLGKGSAMDLDSRGSLTTSDEFLCEGTKVTGTLINDATGNIGNVIASGNLVITNSGIIGGIDMLSGSSPTLKLNTIGNLNYVENFLNSSGLRASTVNEVQTGVSYNGSTGFWQPPSITNGVSTEAELQGALIDNATIIIRGDITLPLTADLSLNGVKLTIAPGCKLTVTGTTYTLSLGTQSLLSNYGTLQSEAKLEVTGLKSYTDSSTSLKGGTFKELTAKDMTLAGTITTNLLSSIGQVSCVSGEDLLLTATNNNLIIEEVLPQAGASFSTTGSGVITITTKANFTSGFIQGVTYVTNDSTNWIVTP